MGTKNNPGNFDCYANAHPDEPMFIILGRDPVGGALVRLWADARLPLVKPGDGPKIAEAVVCADAMDKWCEKVGREPIGSALSHLSFAVLAEELKRRGATVTPAPHGGDFESSSTKGGRE